MNKSCILKNVGMRADGTILYIVDDLNTTPVSTFEHSTFYLDRHKYTNAE